jgi:energy-coupling factor transport system permease protein
MYRRRPSPLHAARASASAAYCGALALVALLCDHPLMLGAELVALVAASVLAGVGPEMRRALRLGLTLALLVALINPLVVREGLTVIVRGLDLPGFGPIDITLEATVYGAILGLRALVVILSFALYSAAVDPDEVLRLFRRVSFRSALTAALATRMVPVLARDARRLADAQRCRPGEPASRLAIVRAVSSGALDRAVDVAATLELRGYATARPLRGHSVPWSRHDVAFAAAAVAIAVLGILAAATGAADVTPYPRLGIAGSTASIVVSLALLIWALAPFGDRRGIVR